MEAWEYPRLVKRSGEPGDVGIQWAARLSQGGQTNSYPNDSACEFSPFGLQDRPEKWVGLCRLNQAFSVRGRTGMRGNSGDDMRGFGIIRDAALCRERVFDGDVKRDPWSPTAAKLLPEGERAAPPGGTIFSWPGWLPTTRFCGPRRPQGRILNYTST